MNLVLIETSGNQAYIFATNKQRENVGASELITQTGKEVVFEAVRDVGGKLPSDRYDPSTYAPISEDNPVEIILAASGKALLLTRDKVIGQKIVRSVTSQSLQKAVGLEVRGVVSRDFDFNSQSIHALIGEVHRQYEIVRSRLSGPALRFQRLPIIAECASSGLPAARVATENDQLALEEIKPYSAQTFSKLRARSAWERRRNEILRRHDTSAQLPDTTNDLEALGCRWLAIVHADGNGLGQVFLDFNRRAQTADNRDYVTKLRNFSMALDECTEKAFCRSLAVFSFCKKRSFIPIVPLILGGDDLTVVCDGQQALRFTKKFIDCFEEETRRHQSINSILRGGVTSCAGVAIIKPHFPFFAGYQLAEELLQSAKKLAKKNPQNPVSAIDYHVVYDASVSDLERIRRELTVDNGETLLIGRPYVTTPNQGPTNRRWEDLERRIDAVRARDEDNRQRLPNSLLHELREGLFLGHQAADARLSLVLQRYREEGLDRLLASDHSLFWPDTDFRRTALLEAIDTAEFWGGQSS